LTEIGQAYYQRCLAMRVEAESAAELIERNRSEPQGLVRISCPTALLNSWVGPMLTRYMLKYPVGGVVYRKHQPPGRSDP